MIVLKYAAFPRPLSRSVPILKEKIKMSEKKIASVACEIPGGFSEYISIYSDASLLDWDIILFLPDFSDFISNDHLFLGKPSLTSDN